MRRAALAAAGLCLAMTSVAHADETKWSADVGICNVWLGPGERPTGGVGVTAGARRSWALSETWALSLGPRAQVFGFTGGVDVAGVFVAPVVGISAALPLGTRVGVEVDASLGRIPMCNSWGLCMPHWGLFPGATGRVGWYTGAVGAWLTSTVRYVNTLAWTGPSIDAVIAGAFRW